MASENDSTKKDRKSSKNISEVTAMNRIGKIIDQLPADARSRVGQWAGSYGSRQASQAQGQLFQNNNA